MLQRLKTAITRKRARGVVTHKNYFPTPVSESATFYKVRGDDGKHYCGWMHGRRHTFPDVGDYVEMTVMRFQRYDREESATIGPTFAIGPVTDMDPAQAYAKIEIRDGKITVSSPVPVELVENGPEGHYRPLQSCQILRKAPSGSA